MNLSLKTWTPYVLLAIIALGVAGGLKLNEVVNKAKTIPPVKKTE